MSCCSKREREHTRRCRSGMSRGGKHAELVQYCKGHIDTAMLGAQGQPARTLFKGTLPLQCGRHVFFLVTYYRHCGIIPGISKLLSDA